MSEQTSSGGIVIARIEQIIAHAAKYRNDAAELVTLAKLAAEREDFTLEHQYMEAARMKRTCADLVESTAKTMHERVVAFASHVLHHYK